ncbi:GTP-binding protein HSR1-related protein [Thermovibrio ammonificans HB-1]|uniref:GTP-binding protein HSR1-related protein n=1 Tax=Thermovibrio ammonificans (strain DSM 15698 / JCM 12110 / HB-1) TaxID=648996 RepID=E8T200_THEA1|nr:dynamin family protein [Thermovibrio ammonificans]ADU96895.1 GTP-binding protein HSR1-related protein [Thermovibrio ammonificans HB-1]
MIQELKETAAKYGLETILQKLEKLEAPIQIKIGFLGEFNSGKSSLINAILGTRILPTMEKPTTKNIIHLIPDKSVEVPEFFKEENGEIIKIEPLEFQEIALGRKEGEALVKIPALEHLPEGIEVVDTPGIASLEKTDTEITFGYLPELDAAIVCQDITFGTIPESVLKFLKRPDVKPLLSKTLFVLTKADRIPQKDIEKVKKHATKVIQTLFKELQIQERVENKIFVTSAKRAFEGDSASIESFLKGLQEEVFKKKEILEKERRLKEAAKIANELAKSLRDLLSKTELDNSQIDREINTVENELYQIEKEKKKLQEAVTEIAEQVFYIAEKLLRAHKMNIVSAEDEDELKQILSQIEEEFTDRINKLIERKLKLSEEFSSITIKEAVNSIKEQIASELKKIEIIKVILTGVLTAIVIPGAGAANAAEGIAGAFISKLGKIGKAVGLEKAGKILAKVIKSINPVEIIGNPVARKYLASKYDEIVPQISSLISNSIEEELEKILEDTFSELQEKEEIKKEILLQLKEQKLNSIKELNKYKQELLQDIEKVEKLARGV